MNWLKNFCIAAFCALVSSGYGQTCANVDSCWAFTITGSSHTIIVPSSQSPLLNGTSLPSGSYIGVFFDAGSGILKCGGYQQWNGMNMSVTAFGNDDTPPNGFASGEQFKVKYLLPSGQIVDNVTAIFSPPDTIGFITHTNTFAGDGISLIQSLSGTAVIDSCAGVNCDDGKACTIDSCSNGNCINTPVSCLASVSGSIVSETGQPVRTVTISAISVADTQTVITGIDGYFDFSLQEGEDYTLTPAKINDSIINNGISTLDIIFMQKQIIQMLPLPLNTPYKLIAADVNGSGTVTTLDIIYTRAVILQSIFTFPNGKLWAFVPDDFIFANVQNPFPFDNSRHYTNMADAEGQDFIAIKLGDVNNSWNPNMPKAAAVGSLQLAMDGYMTKPGSEIIVPVKVKDFKNVTGCQFTLSWNPEVLSLLEVNNKALQGYYGEHRKDEGYLTTTWYNEETKAITLDDDDVAFELKFKVIGAEGSFSPITIGSELTASEAYNENLDLLNIVSQNGIVKVGDSNSFAIRHL